MSDFNLFLAKLYKKLPVLFFDCMAIPIAWYGAYWLRYNFQPFAIVQPTTVLIWVGIIQLACYFHFKVYRGLWCFSSLQDVIRISKAVFSTVILAVPFLYQVELIQQIPRSILPLYAMNLLVLLFGGRFARRVYYEAKAMPERPVAQKKVLIIGAGSAGESLLRDLKRANNYYPVAFVDDDPVRQGKEIHGVVVLGPLEQLVQFVEAYRIELIFIAIPSADSAVMRRIVGFCEKTAVPFRTLPSLSTLISGKVDANVLRPVSLEDLLGRDQISLEWDKINQSVQGKRVVVTGGGGSIGSELCRQVMALQPEKLLIIDNSEYNLYQIELELRANYPDTDVQIALLSVTDSEAVKVCFLQFKPQLVFHAAAYKHVPMLEGQVRIAVLNNVIGTKVMAEISVCVGVEKFILISTDKAVNPTNVMGVTKRVAEIFCQNLNEQMQINTQFVTVRFGNVLGSTGSVVPLFQKQIEAGGPVTVTHPDIKRYFMTIPEACQLILQAMVNGHGGEIFVLDMGEPVKISYLAEQMIKLAGHAPGREIEIRYTGLRPGEKLFEELFHKSERLTPTKHEKLLKASFRRVDWQELHTALQLLVKSCECFQEDELVVLLRSLVPEFSPMALGNVPKVFLQSSLLN